MTIEVGDMVLIGEEVRKLFPFNDFPRIPMVVTRIEQVFDLHSYYTLSRVKNFRFTSEELIKIDMDEELL